MKVVLSPNPYRDRGLKVAIQAKRVLERAGVRTAVCLPFELEGANRSELPGELAYSEMEKELPGADMLICFGGTALSCTQPGTHIPGTSLSWG